MKKIVIIPAYNEEGGIVKTVTDVMENAKDFDYVVINDCSKDNTLEICHEHNFNVVNLPVNMGIGGGVQTGYMYAYRNGYDIAYSLMVMDNIMPVIWTACRRNLLKKI